MGQENHEQAFPGEPGCPGPAQDTMASNSRVRAVRAREELGWRFSLKTAAFLPFMYWYHGLGFLLGLAAYATGRSVAAERAVPEFNYSVQEPE